MFGLDIDGPTIMLNNNEIAVNNSSKIESTLNRKHRSISCHLVLQNVESGLVNIGWILIADNISDAFKNKLTEARRKLYSVIGIIEVTNCIADLGDQINAAFILQL